MSQRPPLPPFTRDTAIQKIRLAEDAWNGRDPSRIVLAYSPDTRWRNRSHGNENWAFDANGLMTHRHASINDRPIAPSERLFHWPLGRRPDDHPGLSELGL